MATATDFSVSTTLIEQNDSIVVPPSMYSFTSSFSALTELSNPSGEAAQYAGYLYYPETSCNETQAELLPSNATLTNYGGLPVPGKVAIAPSTDCRDAYVTQARRDNARALILYVATYTAPPSIPATSNAFSAPLPVYITPLSTVASIIMALNQYSGSISDAPQGAYLATAYPNATSARLVVSVNKRLVNATIPNLWIFLLIVLGLLCLVVGSVSIGLHIHQHLARRDLRNRIAAGEVDLESLGIKRLTVPRKHIEAMSKEVYAGQQVQTDKSGVMMSFDTSCCAICLEDYVRGETEVRRLPCCHLFHPTCIDDFLAKRSSLCPLCKRSVLPAGYIPPDAQLTSATIMRERRRRRQAQRDANRTTSNGAAGDIELQPHSLPLSQPRSQAEVPPQPSELNRRAAIELDPNIPTTEQEQDQLQRRGPFQRIVAFLFPTGRTID
ncbi:hypothetical protein PYCC9005_004589 [Savitreella phatthalungensis]